MATIEQLKREVQMLRAKQSNLEDLRKIQKERVMLQREIKQLKNPRSIAFKKTLNEGIKLASKGASKGWGILKTIERNYYANEKASNSRSRKRK